MEKRTIELKNGKTIEIEVKPPVERPNNEERVRAFRASGGNILHIRPRRFAVTGRVTRGLTVAFVIRSGRIEVATAVQHRTDCFSKKIGTKTAIEHFLSGKTVSLPLRPGNHTTEDFKQAFSWLV